MAKLASRSNVISHWHHPVGNFHTSTMEFYTAVEEALQPHEVPGLSTSRVDWKEGGAISARREYLRIKRGRLAFDLCAAPFGRDFFFSWWMAEVPPPYGLLWAFVFIVVSFALIGIFIDHFGLLLGLFLAALVIPGLIWLLGYLAREGELGPGADDVLLAIPFFGGLYERIIKPVTYYKMDTALMFQAAVHAAVTEVVDRTLSAKGARTLTEFERKPILQEFYQR